MTSEDGVVEAMALLVPEAVEKGGVGESFAILGDVLVVENDVGHRALLSMLESLSDLIEKHLLVLLAGCLELSSKLGIALVALLLDVGDLLGLDLAELGSGDDGLGGHF